jgi:hypothetical protein
VSVPLEYLANLNSHLNLEIEGKVKFIAVTYALVTLGSATQIGLFLFQTFVSSKGFHLNYFVLHAILQAIWLCFCREFKNCSS